MAQESSSERGGKRKRRRRNRRGNVNQNEDHSEQPFRRPTQPETRYDDSRPMSREQEWIARSTGAVGRGRGGRGRGRGRGGGGRGGRNTRPPKEIPVYDAEFFDTHCHMDWVLFKQGFGLSDYTDFIGKEFKGSFGGCVHVACAPESIPAAIRLAEQPNIYVAFGIHPHNAKEYTDEVERKLFEAVQHEKCVAWGECGLDYHYNHSPRPVQREVFARQIRNAVDRNLPLIVHSREAEEDTMTILRENLPRDHRVHIHCFTDTLEFARAIIDEFPNSFIGFTGAITFKKAQDNRNTVRNLPLDRILLETDGPYMSPEPFRGKVAHPGHIPLVARQIAELHGIEDVNVVLRQCRENARRMYGV